MTGNASPSVCSQHVSLARKLCVTARCLRDLESLEKSYNPLLKTGSNIHEVCLDAGFRQKLNLNSTSPPKWRTDDAKEQRLAWNRRKLFLLFASEWNLLITQNGIYSWFYVVLGWKRKGEGWNYCGSRMKKRERWRNIGWSLVLSFIHRRTQEEGTHPQTDVIKLFVLCVESREMVCWAETTFTL
jgi:hypothetical protein